jgi:hypothetical protein
LTTHIGIVGPVQGQQCIDAGGHGRGLQQYDGRLMSGAIGEVMTVAGIELDFVGPALAIKVSDNGPGLIVGDQSAGVGELVIMAERDARPSGATGCIPRCLGEIGHYLLEVERRLPRNPQGQTGAGVAKVAAPVLGML